MEHHPIVVLSQRSPLTSKTQALSPMSMTNGNRVSTNAPTVAVTAIDFTDAADRASVSTTPVFVALAVVHGYLLT
jgi:hypothetical protein